MIFFVVIGIFYVYLKFKLRRVYIFRFFYCRVVFFGLFISIVISFIFVFYCSILKFVIQVFRNGRCFFRVNFYFGVKLFFWIYVFWLFLVSENCFYFFVNLLQFDILFNNFSCLILAYFFQIFNFLFCQKQRFQ